MKYTIKINPAYEYLRGFVEQLPATFEQQGTVIYTGRNLIKVMDAGGMLVNVKRYAVPFFLNRVIYSFFRQPKGLRAFLYPQRLLERGFETPEAIAYIEERSGGLLRHSYFVSVQSPYRRNFYEFGDADVDSCRDIVCAFARYTAALHEAGIMHRDYSPGNILFDEVDGKYHFLLVDINRMYFGKVSVKQGCANFARLWGQKAFFVLLAAEYARARKADEAYCVEQVLEKRRQFWSRLAKKRPVSFRLEL